MANLSLSYSDLQKAVAYLLGYSTDSADWDSQETYVIDQAVQSGYRRFLYPMLGGSLYRWSFLTTTATLDTVSGTEGYNRETDDAVFISAVIQDWPHSKLTLIGMPEMRRMLPDESSGRPRFIAVDDSKVYLYPIPDAVYEIETVYEVKPEKLSSTNTAPLGADIHSETLLAAVKASAAMNEDDDGQGMHKQLFLERLSASISQDRKAKMPDTLGYNGDPGIGRNDDRRMQRDRGTTTVNDNLLY